MKTKTIIQKEKDKVFKHENYRSLHPDTKLHILNMVKGWIEEEIQTVKKFKFLNTLTDNDTKKTK